LENWASWFHVLSWLMVLLGIGSCIFVFVDLERRQPQPMAIMRAVWPINTLWAGLFGIWACWKMGRMEPLPGSDSFSHHSSSTPIKMAGMDKASRPFWQGIVAATLHCGAGCSLADLMGPLCISGRALSRGGQPGF
jgi:hypothetical protein